MIVLDTSALIDLFRGGEEIRTIIDDDAATTAINYHEIFVGVRRHKAKAEERLFRRIFSDVKILDFDQVGAERSSEIMGRLLAFAIPISDWTAV